MSPDCFLESSTFILSCHKPVIIQYEFQYRETFINNCAQVSVYRKCPKLGEANQCRDSWLGSFIMSIQQSVV